MTERETGRETASLEELMQTLRSVTTLEMTRLGLPLSASSANVALHMAVKLIPEQQFPIFNKSKCVAVKQSSL